MATNRFFQAPASGSAVSGHIPTKPFGINRIAGLTPAAGDIRASVKPFRAFRFMVPTLPTGGSQALSATTPPAGSVEQPFDANHPHPHEPAPLRNESPGTKNWPLLLSVIVLLVCAFTCVFWLATSELPEKGARPNEPAPAAHLAWQGSAQPAAVVVDSNPEPAVPATESMRAAPAATPERAMIPGVGSGSAAQEISAPGRAENAKTLRGSSTSSRPTVPASAPPKKDSVLNSVLAPPPA
jgi:hypothetical protein